MEKLELNQIRIENKNASLSRIEDGNLKKEFNIKQKRKKIIAIMVGLALSQSTNLMAASFLPVYVELYYPKISLSMVGLVLRYYLK